MSSQGNAKIELASVVADVRRVPLNRVASAADDSMRRIVPKADSSRVSVAAFNASL